MSFYDLRYQRQAQQSILDAEREKQSNEAKSKFLANMSHEIRSPLVSECRFDFCFVVALTKLTRMESLECYNY